MGEINHIDLATINNLGKNVARGADEKQALKSFDAYFLGEILKQSAPSNPTGLFDGGQAGRMYQEHFYQELAHVIASHGGFGLQESLAGQLGLEDSEASEPEASAPGNGPVGTARRASDE